MKKSKKFLASLLSLTLLFPVKSSANGIEKTYNESRAKISTKNESGWSVLKFIFEIFMGSVFINSGKEVYQELEYKKNMYELSQDFSKRYANELTDCQITKKQEGKMWCWIACLQGLLRYNGINKRQKEIFKGISNSVFVSTFECNRNAGLSIYNSEQNMKDIKNCNCNYKDKDIIFPNMIRDYVERISNGRLTYQIAYIRPHSGERNIKNSIYDVYKKIGRKPFSLLANHTPSGHFINVFKIDSKGIMYIEDPAFEKGRKEPIDEYVKHFDINIKRAVDSANGIMIGFVTEKNNELENPWFWSASYKMSNKMC